ncbi:MULTISPECIES: maleylpyruvate isomerase family mycothiol-dependent enzyme [unclassified Isoptericola]|uniref:maleylpyruvate isomerase family mycothiol-dependent enzyme n=1 Tax=unclassified Isoptericola TaxID=2623355 RepID=UPI002713DFD0|nr:MULTISPECIES: maleylpyruvate isomerase family mycothiol-dependent enzyme [unclassified Isoptericola]MDO8145916.1 maleylpyruvate isomerase family mycothiol-dependent enzyme [Isoptericola sp. 178]MDO8147767.1 maleylpyruvate isomerase family mycothiol-dependent enzyme [Isoptericola sp. b515]
MTTTTEILDDFLLEAADLRGLLASLDDDQWELVTPAEPWRVRDQVAHLTFVFTLAAAAASDTERFAAMTAPAADVGFDAAVNHALDLFNAGTPAEVLGRFDTAVDDVERALRSRGPDDVVPWLVNPLPAAVLTAAGMLELFAHGQDVADAVGVGIVRTDRVRHLVPFIHRTIAFGYQARDLDVPQGSFRFAVSLPSGAAVEAGDEYAPNIVCGEAVDLALLASRRRHPDDLVLHAIGPDAWTYLDVAQAYRGPAGTGREPLAAGAATV